MRRLGAVVLAATLAATDAAAAPTIPTNIKVVPVYSTPRQMRFTWTENGTAHHYNVFKKTDPSPTYALLMTISGGVAGQVVDVLDEAVVPTESYTYRVETCDATGCLSDVPRSAWAQTVWPISGGQEVLHGYNEVIGWAGLGDPVALGATTLPATGFHNGVDLNKTTTNPAAGDDVYAPRGGVVTVVSTGAAGTIDNGFVQVRVDLGGGEFEFDGFNHLATTGGLFTSLTVGRVVGPGQRIGRVGTQLFANGNIGDHVHWQLASSTNPIRINIRHNLQIFDDPADRDPGGTPPALCDENMDGKSVLYRSRPAGSLIAYDVATTPILGDVDVEAEVCDQQGTNPRQAPIDLGYWIEGPLPDSEQLDDVKSAAHPYRLYDFRTEHYGGLPTTNCTLLVDIASVANAGCTDITSCTTRNSGPCPTSAIREGTHLYYYPVLHHFVVTHAGDELGGKASISATQFWRTAAKDDGTPATGPNANFHDRAVTTKATEARFPDGDYTIHVVASDLVHPNVDLELPVTRLENFAPFVKEVLVGLDADGSAGSGQPGLPGCEVLVYDYKHTHRQAYPRPEDLVLSNVATTLARSGQKLCVRLRFSEPMTSAAVDLARDRGAGTVVAPFTGALSKTHQTDDTWSGALVLPPDPSGDPGAPALGDESDLALRISARDRRNAAGAMRLLDANSDGVPDAGGDVNHVVLKADMTPPTATLDVIKP